MQQSNVPSDRKKGPVPPNNELKSFSGRQKECVTRKRKGMLCSELQLMNPEGALTEGVLAGQRGVRGGRGECHQ